MKWASIFLLLQFYLLTLFAQDSTALVKYERGFKFRDGIYFSFNDFKQNTPSILYSNIVSEESGYFKYKNYLGEIKEIKKKDTWGYSKGGNVYKFIGLDFYQVAGIHEYVQIMMIGTICHFTNFYQKYMTSSIHPYGSAYLGEEAKQ